MPSSDISWLMMDMNTTPESSHSDYWPEEDGSRGQTAGVSTGIIILYIALALFTVSMRWAESNIRYKIWNAPKRKWNHPLNVLDLAVGPIFFLSFSITAVCTKTPRFEKDFYSNAAMCALVAFSLHLIFQVLSLGVVYLVVKICNMVRAKKERRQTIAHQRTIELQTMGTRRAYQ